MKIKYAIIFLIMILATNGVFANCNVVIPTGSPLIRKVSCDCNHDKLECNCNINDSVLVNTTAPPFSLTNCNNYKVNFYTNGYNFLLKSDFNFTNPDNKINLIANNNSNIIIYDDAKTIILPNIIVNSGKTLDIKTYNYLQKTAKSYILKIESIFVYPNANLNLNLKSNDGISGKGYWREADTIRNKVVDLVNYEEDWTKYVFLGGYVLDVSLDQLFGGKDYVMFIDGTSGYLKLDINSINNYGVVNIKLKTGDGGDGGNRGDDDIQGGDDYHQDGGFGGHSGDVNFNIKFIENYNDLIINLETGKGGKGGYSAIDDTDDEHMDGGNGGSTGNIHLGEIEKIINYKKIEMEFITGDAGFGGVQRAESSSDCDNGHNGWGGSSGSIDDINIETLLNKSVSSTFKLGLKNGSFGEIDITPNKSCKAENKAGGAILTFGAPGKIGDVTIGFLENKSSNGLDITSIFNLTQRQYDLAVVATSNNGIDGEDNGGNMRQLPDLNLKLSNIKINYLSNGSYLPKTIFASIPIDNYEYFNNDIRIKGCYINPTTVDYEIKDHTRIEATNSDVISMLNSEFDLTSNYCPHCEVMPLDDSQNRYTRDYSLFSNINGTIDTRDLNVYYSNPLNQSKYYTKRTDNKQLPVYTNKNPISGVFNQKTNNYEYKIKPEDLIYYSHTPEDDIDELNQEDYLFCYGQEYILDGKITSDGGTIKNFNFPFVPLRELFSD